MTSDELTTAVYVISVIVCAVFTFEMCMTLAFRMTQGQRTHVSTYILPAYTAFGRKGLKT